MNICKRVNEYKVPTVTTTPAAATGTAVPTKKKKTRSKIAIKSFDNMVGFVEQSKSLHVMNMIPTFILDTDLSRL